ncbi:MAG: DUF1643 domain-containing protein [Ruminococcus sp.]|nr:DUF1643 domain-containing protein [Ruminococcus sp.]
MKNCKSIVETEIITSDDGLHTYELIKRLVGCEGECGYLISLYPTRTAENIFSNDSTLNHLVSHMQELGFSELHIVNLFSKAVASQRGLTVDEENMQYIEKLMSSKEFANSKFVIAWGNSMQNSQAVSDSKVRIFNIFLKHCSKGKLYQITTMDRNIEPTPAPHPLFLGIRASSSVWGLQEFKIKKPSQAIIGKTKSNSTKAK